MEEIPAGTHVKVAMTQKGKTTVRDAEVLAYMPGVVHVQMDGQAVSVHPSQILAGDAPAAAAMPPDDGSAKVFAELVADLAEQIAQLKAYLSTLAAWVATLEARQTPADPAPEPSPVPAQQNPTADESTAAAESGEPAAGS